MKFRATKLARKARYLTGLSMFLLAACGGNGGDGGLLGGVIDPDDDDLLTWQSGEYQNAALYQNRCETPRTGTNPFDDDRPFPDEQGSVAFENFFLRSWNNDLYLWYDEVEDRNPNSYTSTAQYFNLLKTPELTPSGRPKDNFHFTQNTEDYLTQTVGGLVFGYGMNVVITSGAVPRNAFVRDVVPGSPADLGGVTRGMTLISVDGEDFINGGDVDTLVTGLGPSVVGEAHTFVFRPADSDENATVTISSANIDVVPVKALRVVNTPTGDVGYIHFNSHIAPAEVGLRDAFQNMLDAGVTDLVLDMRYNLGGLLFMAGEVAYMVAGDASSNSTFYRFAANDKQPAGQEIPFPDESLGFDTDLLAGGLDLPALDLSTVYILSTSLTCSASEAVINGLRGIGVTVVLIGDTTCGKPYGFVPQDNCGTTYFSVQFEGVNDQGFGEYPDGFSPANQPDAPGVIVPGCWVEDDFSHELNDPEEALFAAALQYREDGSCPAISTSMKSRAAAKAIAAQKTTTDDNPFTQIGASNSPGLSNAIIQR